MANLKELRNRIVSIGSTMQITSAMKMVAAAKLKRAQDNIQQMRPYAEKLQELLNNLSSSLDQQEGVYSEKRAVKKVLLVSLTSNRGLCGGFNANVIRQSKRRAASYAEQGVSVSFITIGKKANDILRKTEFEVVKNASSLYENVTFEAVVEIAEEIMADFAAGTYDRVEIIYNQFKNAASQIVQTEEFLPLQEVEGVNSSNATDYIFEPGKEEIVEELIPKSLKTQLFKAVLDSIASEQGARMTAMHKATDNAKELQRVLRLDYNKARQAAITNEILEIVGGAAALEG